MSKPLLTIGIIFRDDIRCIERCLKALRPLRDAVPCELVMADTGSTDGSRAVAEQYADILFDFPWVNDFSAARNAVMDRASGKWYFTVDTDEYLDEDVSELKDFLGCSNKKYNAATVVQRNYRSYEIEMDEDYTDFNALRLLKMSTGLRYKGEIHEAWSSDHDDVKLYGPSLTRTILHHDGYVGLYDERGAERCRRNLTLLRKNLEENPESLRTRLEIIESGLYEPDVWDIIQQAVDLIEGKKPTWNRYGPSILRYAVTLANEQKREDTEEWIERANRLFPDSIFTRVDVQYVIFARCIVNENFADCIEPGEGYLQAIQDVRAHKAEQELTISSLQLAVKGLERGARVALAEAYRRKNQPERTLEMLEGLDFAAFEPTRTAQAASTLLNLHFKSKADTASVLMAFWEGLTTPKPSQEAADSRREIFLAAAAGTFTRQSMETELQAPDFCRHAYTLFLPLEDACDLGRAAAILLADDPAVLEEKLSKVENWAEFPIPALVHALEQGVNFPLPDKRLTLEEMDNLAAQMSEDKESIISLACGAAPEDYNKDWQNLTWVRGVVLAAVRVFGWSAEDAEVGTGLALARAFAQMEKNFLPFCYASQVMCRKNLFVLPSMHRFGWYCAQAFDALDAGDAAEYVRLLREGLAVCEGVKEMAQFLLDHTPELHQPEPSAELRDLADKIRMVLAKFSPDDPAVAALKQSEAYQKVAVLIEGAEVPIVGGLMQ